MKVTEQPPRVAGGQEGKQRKWGGSGRGFGKDREITNIPGDQDESGATAGGSANRGASALPNIYLLTCGPPLLLPPPVPEGPGGNATGRGSPAHPALPAPRLRPTPGAGATPGLARCARRRPGAHPRLLSGGHPSPSPSRPPGRGAHGWRPAGCLAGLRAGKATAPRRRRRAEPTRPSAPWTRCPARPQ